MVAISGRQGDRTGQDSVFECTNFVEDFSMDCNGDVEVVADTLATLIRELARKGIIHADITT
jgi:hypothetical protein